MVAGAIIGSMALSASAASKQRKLEREAMEKNEAMLEREIAEREKGYTRMLPLYQQMLGNVKTGYADMMAKVKESGEKTTTLLGGAQRAVEQGYRDALAEAGASATAGSMGTGRYGSVLAAQMGAGAATQAARAGESSMGQMGQVLAMAEQQQSGRMIGLQQQGLAAETGALSNIAGLDQWRVSGNTQSMMNTVYQAPQPGQDMGASLMMAMGLAGGPKNFFATA